MDTVRGHDGEVLYSKCVDVSHHHLVCRRCGDAVEIPNGPVLLAPDRLVRDAGYAETKVGLEVFGLCRTCAALPRGPS